MSAKRDRTSAERERASAKRERAKVRASAERERAKVRAGSYHTRPENQANDFEKVYFPPSFAQMRETLLGTRKGHPIYYRASVSIIRNSPEEVSCRV